MPHKSLLVASRHEQHPTVVAKLFRKRLAVASETSAAEALNEEQVKNLTGGDRLEGRRMREDPWEFWPTHTLVMFSNHKPAIRGRDEGIWRRVRLVPWQVTIAAKDRDELLATKLQAEAAGILRWIVEGAVRFHRDGLDPPAAVLAATAGYRQSEDVIGRFCDEALDFNPHVYCLLHRYQERARRLVRGAGHPAAADERRRSNHATAWSKRRRTEKSQRKAAHAMVRCVRFMTYRVDPEETP